DADFSVRQLDLGTENTPSVSLVAAHLLATNDYPQLENAWLNYYCRPDQFPAVMLDRVLADGLAPNYFRDKIVVIGAKPEARVAGADREEFGNPYSKAGAAASPGAAVHALSLLNLVNGDFIRRLSVRQEMFIAVIWGVLICVGLMRLAPWLALVVAVFAAFFFAVAALYIQLRYHLWFSWTVPACAQTATALVWAVGYRYTIVWNHRQKLRRAFAAHVSSHVVDLIANSEYDLAPGGKEV